MCDERKTGDLLEQRCYLRYVDVFSPRPNFGAIFAFVTADGNDPRNRHLITGTRPHIDSTAVTVEIAARERDGDTVSFNSAESLETTGVAPAWASGNYIRARIRVPAASTWTLAKGIETDSVPAGVQ